MALDMVAAHAAYFSDIDRAQALAREQRALAERLGDPYHVAVAVMRQGWSAGTSAPGARSRTRPFRCCAAADTCTASSSCQRGWPAPRWARATTRPPPTRPAKGSGPPRRVAGRSGSRSRDGNAALAALCLERMDVAERLFHEQIEVCRRERIDMLWAEPATGLACVAARAGEPERAATFLGFAEAVPTMPPAEGDLVLHDRLVAKYIAPAREALGERAWKRAAATGAAMTPDQMGEFALERPARAGTT